MKYREVSLVILNARQDDRAVGAYKVLSNGSKSPAIIGERRRVKCGLMP